MEVKLNESYKSKKTINLKQNIFIKVGLRVLQSNKKILAENQLKPFKHISKILNQGKEVNLHEQIFTRKPRKQNDIQTLTRTKTTQSSFSINQKRTNSFYF